MEQDIFDIIKVKSYTELTEEELLEINEMVGGEDEYLNMQLVLNEVEAMHSSEVFQPDIETKESLDAIFAAESFPKKSPIWYNGILTSIYPREKKIYQRPLVQVAAVLLLFISFFPLLINSDFKNESQELALNKNEKDQTPLINKSSEREQLNIDAIETKSSENNDVKIPHEFSKDEVQKQDFEDLNLEVTHKGLAFANVPSGNNTFGLYSAKKVDFESPRSNMNHPDGVFDEKESDKSSVGFSVSVGYQPEVLDILTATF